MQCQSCLIKFPVCIVVVSESNEMCCELVPILIFSNFIVFSHFIIAIWAESLLMVQIFGDVSATSQISK